MGDEFGGAKPKLPSGSKKTKSKKSHDDKINIQNGQPQSLEQSPPLNGYHGVSRVQDYLVDDDMYNNRKVDNKDSVKKNDFEMMDAKYKDLVLSTEQEYLSAKERWKKSGQALRKYFTEKLRFKNERQVEKGKRLVHSSKPSNKHVSKKVQLKSASSEGTSKGIPRSKSFLERMGFKKDTRTIEEKLDSLRSSQIDLTQPLTLDLLERSTYDLSGAMEMAHGELDVQAPTSADSSFDSDQLRRMYMDDYDYLLMERPYNELDWLDIDNTPLSVMLEDVIQQMLSVQPELLADQATPPAPSIVIDMLPTVTLTQQLIDHHQSCSICLCPCELEEIMTQLPCQHIFHPICIQAWLSKSGTCPVCRGKVSRQESC
ncbi:RN181-like protein [Mya arenaria]|uniref:RN181-like protein n=1 Tax=Mya arenaria TaxID=6604 RepID=A0ABY7G097_MYAAR|nr:RN181-like protein [Mya arenaria]